MTPIAVLLVLRSFSDTIVLPNVPTVVLVRRSFYIGSSCSVGSLALPAGTRGQLAGGTCSSPRPPVLLTFQLATRSLPSASPLLGLDI